jgi:hypothetical protein
LVMCHERALPAGQCGDRRVPFLGHMCGLDNPRPPSPHF